MFAVLKKKLQERFLRYFYHHFMSHIQRMLAENIDYVLGDAKKRDKVVYTCLTGDYDALPLYEYLDSRFDYICFTDNKELLRYGRYGFWTIKPLVFTELDNQLNNRWHKTHPHILFPDYDESIYIDSNITILSPAVFDEVDSKNGNIMIPLHFKNSCIYDECMDVLKKNLASKKDVESICNLLKNDGFPKNYGLNENNFMYRRHKDSTVINIMEDWWKLILNYCKRDQLSLAYVLWKYGIRPYDIAIKNLRLDKRNFYFSGHKK